MRSKYGILFILFLGFGLTSCDALFNAFDDSAFKEGLEASRGVYTNCIVLDWPTDSYYSSEDEGYIEADSYFVTKYEDTDSGFSEIDGFYTTESYYEDFDVVVGEIYYYRVESNGIHFEHETNRTWGYALVFSDLDIGDSQGDAVHLVETTSPPEDDSWFQFDAQENYTYHFKSLAYLGIGGDSDLDVPLVLYQKHIRDIDIVTFTSTSGFGEITWTCTESDSYYLKTTETSGSYFQLTSWVEAITPPEE